MSLENCSFTCMLYKGCASSLFNRATISANPFSLLFNYIVSPVHCKQGELIKPRSVHYLTCCITFPVRCVKIALPTAHTPTHTSFLDNSSLPFNSGAHIYPYTDTLNPSLIPLSGSAPVPSCQAGKGLGNLEEGSRVASWTATNIKGYGKGFPYNWFNQNDQNRRLVHQFTWLF